MAADFGPVTHDGTEFFQAGGNRGVGAADDDFAVVEADVGKNDPGAEMRFVAEDGITHVVEVRNLRGVEDDAVFEFAGVAEDGIVAHDDIFADVATGADLAAIADPSRAFDHGALFDRGAVADVDGIADKGAADLFAMDGRLEAELEIGGDEREGFPDIGHLLKQGPVVGVLEVEVIGGRESHGRSDEWRVTCGELFNRVASALNPQL